MSIISQIEDAQLLIDNKRYLSALTLLLLAIAASSRKFFPKGSLSITNSNKKMRDEEAFTRFLGGRLQRVINRDIGGDKPRGNITIMVSSNGDKIPFEEAVYQSYRCYLIHEGTLSSEVEFIDDITPGEDLVNETVGGYYVQLSDKTYAGVSRRKSNQNMLLTYAWLDIFMRVVVYADCNNDIFGRRIKDIFLKQHIVEQDIVDYINDILDVFLVKDDRRVKGQVLPSGMENDGERILDVLKRVILDGGLNSGTTASDAEIQDSLQKYHDTKTTHNRPSLRWLEFTGMLKDDSESRDKDMLTTNYYAMRAHIESGNLFTTELTPKGILILRKVTESYEVR